ncbi:preprotein translocase subunit Sec61beta [Promethearchaeum syntrophicum]|uniref:Preprotein translocase subunit Sec61beta n=1 Tax=Promethearchaeum syntrophicum TaxID=2594042 RepID=A0A5B9DBY0_9ARCH|nr:preprotein translocase subunit Sec61beta [Candidatus Prometheoarchaeum syntrophicum]QEE16186.1 preprotein translocase subunit SecG [Candidatus Prometheoarchaeum syntrophicum]
MSQRKKSARQKKRSSDTPMPSGGAGLIRFYQDQSNGIKVSAITAIVFSILLIVVVIIAQVGWLEWLLGS